MSENAFQKLENLSNRVLSGEVVFFIGAGFSLDSEHNYATRLMRRLIVRFAAIIDTLKKVKSGYLISNNKKSCDDIKKVVTELKEGLVRTFDLPYNRKLHHEKNIKALSSLYYQINDWICSAYSILLEEMKRFKNGTKLCNEINQLENQLLKSSNSDKEPLKAIELNKYSTLNFQRAGKALFLDTMGFDNPKIMGGSPFKPDIRDVLKSYHQRLLKRHHVLARLAREGLSNPLITTNYDLLLEGAYRLAGFIPRRQNIKKPGTRVLYPYFECIADASHFFNYGYAHRTAVITKIHGCVNRYRSTKIKQWNTLEQNAKKPNKPDNKPGNKYWEKYLSSMVFTFREIQNWRGDAWSRDYIRTLLRTHTIVFCGYSIADPVLHDTFRSVYEEMEKQREMSVPIPDINKNKKNPTTAEIPAPAFFFGLSQKKEFHGMEILRAASKAVGIEPYEITNHPNYVQFFIEKDKFPNLDELMLWLYHLTCRNFQCQCLENNLQQISMYLLDHPCPLGELKTIKDGFKLLFRREKECAANWNDESQNRDSMSRITNWSEYFHPELLKQYAFAEDQMLVQGVRSKIGDKSSPFWHYPFTERPGWTAWSVVVEIALRKMVSAWQERFENWEENTNLLEALPSATPAVSFSRVNKFKTHTLLELKLQDTDSIKFSSKTSGAFRQKFTWLLNQEALPWNKADDRNTPGAKTIWKWAAKEKTENISEEDINELARYFGERI